MADMSSEYRFVVAPAGLKRLSSFRWTNTLIDYAQHPAYRDLVAGRGVGERARALAIYAKRLVPLIVKRTIFYEMIPGQYRYGKTFGSRLAFAGHAIRNALHLGRGARRQGAVPVTPCAEALDRDGIAVMVMPAAQRETLDDLAKPYFEKLAAKRGTGANRREFDESRSTLDRTAAPELFAHIEKVFAESGLSEAVDAYLGRKARVIDVNPQINDSSDSFWRDIFEDQPSDEIPKAAYCHRDASGGDIKVILYCSDVGDENGPFSYAVGSNNMRISRIDNFLCEANDHNGLSLTSLEARRTFAALPKRLRQKGAFGNDLIDGSAVSGEIVDSLWEVTAPAGAVVAFDTKGVHRGGMLRKGERRVLTCVLC